jgi:hypothetical protein
MVLILKPFTMKRTLTSISLLLAATCASGQIYTQLSENNNVRYRVNNNGTFFYNVANEMSGYFIPKDSGTATIYSMNLQALGVDANSQLKGAVSSYGASDFFPGPIATNYTNPDYQADYATSLWPMSKADVDYHIAHWQDVGYTLPYTIAEWPGNGNSMNGEASVLAPYVDVNGDDLYNPSQGDYPLIRGDRAVFSIVNDGAHVHPSGSDPAGMEVHLLFYQYNSPSEEVTNTTFINATVYNRGTQTLYDFQLGAFIDFDLGNPQDDYIGTMPDKNLAYVYNADLMDESFSGLAGFGVMPPAAGVMSLSQDLYSHVNLSPNLSLPATAAQYYNVLKGYDIYGSPMTDDQGQATRYAYYGDSLHWTEVAPQPNSPSNFPGDRRSTIGMSPTTFMPGQQLCYDLAVVYGRSSYGGIFSSVNNLGTVATHIQEFYDQQQFNCISGMTGLDESQELAVRIFPNPATTELHVDGLQQGDFRIVTTDGKTVVSGSFDEQTIDVSKLRNGYYLLIISHDGNGKMISFVKQ